MIDLTDMRALTISDLIPNDRMCNKRLDLVLMALEQKILDIPARISNSNKHIDFNFGDAESIMIDVTDVSTEIYEIVSCIREFIPISGDY